MRKQLKHGLIIAIDLDDTPNFSFAEMNAYKLSKTT